MKPRVDPAVIHQVAQSLCFAMHGDWRYDPGKKSHRKWRRRAERFVLAARVTSELSPLDSDRYVRMVGMWVHRGTS
jgi:hypothetical protein